MQANGTSARREAIFILAQWLETGDFPFRMIAPGVNHSFVVDLTGTVLRRFRTLDWVIGRFVKKMPMGETRAALLVGAAQLLYMPSVKVHAALNETVEAAKRASHASAPFVNAVLRSILRSRSHVLDELAGQSMGVRYSHPDVLVNRWLSRYGADRTADLCVFNNLPPAVFLAYPPERDERYVELRRGERIEEIDGYRDGAFIVQDPATAHAVDLLEVAPGMNVLDACSAPGGKTVQIAWRMKGEGRLTACDAHEDRLAVLRENLKRTNLEFVEIRRMDMTNPIPSEAGLTNAFDRILLDVPCSNTGVLRRRADARWRWSEKRMKALVETQRKILDHAVMLLKPGGRIVYSTCSLESEENLMQVEAFLARHPNFSLASVKESFPPDTGCDGAFAAALDLQGDGVVG